MGPYKTPELYAVRDFDCCFTTEQITSRSHVPLVTYRWLRFATFQLEAKFGRGSSSSAHDNHLDEATGATARKDAGDTAGKPTQEVPTPGGNETERFRGNFIPR